MKVQLIRNNNINFLEPATLGADGNASFEANSEQEAVHLIGYRFVPETDIERVICERFLPPIGWFDRFKLVHPGDSPRVRVDLSGLWQAIATRRLNESSAREIAQRLRAERLPNVMDFNYQRPLTIERDSAAERRQRQIEIEQHERGRRDAYVFLQDLYVEGVNSSNLNSGTELEQAAQWNFLSLDHLPQPIEPDRVTRSCSNCEYFLKLQNTKICNAMQTPSDREYSETDCAHWQQINAEERSHKNRELQRQVREVETPGNYGYEVDDSL